MSKKRYEKLFWFYLTPANIFSGFLSGFLVGIVIGMLWINKWLVLFFLLLTLLVSAVLFLWGNNLKIVFLFFLSGGLLLGLWRTEIALKEMNGWLEGKYNGPARIIKMSEEKNDYQRVYFEIKNIKSGEGFQQIKKEIVVAFVPLGVKYQYGKVYNLECQLKNPENKYPKFNYRRFLASKKVYQICQRAKVSERNNQPTDNFFLTLKIKFYQTAFWFSQMVAGKIDQLFTMPESGYLAGLLLGGDSRLPTEVAESFRRTGTTHTVAVSGTNIAIVVVFLSELGFLIGFSRKQLFYLVSLGVIFFVVMIGMPASAVRAGITGVLIFYALQIGRQANSLRLMIFVAGLMVFYSPFLILYDVGFQLSFSALLGIILFYDFLAEKFNCQKDFLGIKSILAMTISAQVGVLGILMYTFNGVSIISLIANSLILPFIPFMMFGGAVSLVVSYFSMGLAQLIALPVQFVLHSEILAIHYLAQPSWAMLEFENFSIWLALVYYSILGGVFIYLKK